MFKELFNQLHMLHVGFPVSGHLKSLVYARSVQHMVHEGLNCRLQAPGLHATFPSAPDAAAFKSLWSPPPSLVFAFCPWRHSGMVPPVEPVARGGEPRGPAQCGTTAGHGTVGWGRLPAAPWRPAWHAAPCCSAVAQSWFDRAWNCISLCDRGRDGIQFSRLQQLPRYKIILLLILWTAAAFTV